MTLFQMIAGEAKQWEEMSRCQAFIFMKGSVMKNIFLFPSRNFLLSVLIVLVSGFAAGLIIDTSGLRKYILLVSIIVVYPAMVGYKIGEILKLSHRRLISISMLLNFIFIPLLAYALGGIFFRQTPFFLAGLLIISLLPTSNLTIAFTAMTDGNVPGAIQINFLGLITGALLAPWYLLLMLGQYIPIDILTVFKTIATVIFVPLLLGTLTYYYLLKKYSEKEFNTKLRPYFLAASAWGMVYIIFVSISVNSSRIISRPELLLFMLIVLLFFYAIIYLASVQIGKHYLNTKDSIALIFGSALRNLAIGIGLAATAFGPDAVLLVTLAFVIQPPLASLFMRMNQKYDLLQAK